MRIACFCGHVFTGDEQSACPHCHTPVTPTTSRLDAWVAERAQILGSMGYAFAMGHGCSIGPKDSRERDLLQRFDDLTALIQEHDARSAQ